MSGSMRCTTPHDIILLLKSSEFIAHDLTMAFADVEGGAEISASFRAFELILRNWITVNPSNEFRCFVRDKQLLGACALNVGTMTTDGAGISQRDYTNFYPSVKQDQDAIYQVTGCWSNPIYLHAIYAVNRKYPASSGQKSRQSFPSTRVSVLNSLYNRFLTRGRCL